MRLRGNKGRTTSKRGYRFDLQGSFIMKLISLPLLYCKKPSADFGHKKRTFYGMKSFSFDSETNCPAQMNQFIAGLHFKIPYPSHSMNFDVFAVEMHRMMGIPGNRMSFGQLFVNDVRVCIFGTAFLIISLSSIG